MKENSPERAPIFRKLPYKGLKVQSGPSNVGILQADTPSCPTCENSFRESVTKVGQNTEGEL